MKAEYDKATGRLTLIPQTTEGPLKIRELLGEMDPRHVKEGDGGVITINLSALRTYSSLTWNTGKEADGSG